MDIAAVFAEIEESMRADFRRIQAAEHHFGTRGESWEEVLRQFLSSYLTGSMAVSSGLLIDSHGGVSRQLDVIIYDAAETPVLFRSSGARVIPIEYAFAVFEVKSHLNKAELTDAFRKMESVYTLRAEPPRKRARVIETKYHDGRTEVTREIIEEPFEGIKGIERSPYYPISFFLFAFSSIKLERLMNYIAQDIATNQRPVHQRLDAVCVLTDGLIVNKLSQGNDSITPGPGSALHTTE